MTEVISKVEIKKEKGYLYYLDKNGNVARTKMARGKDKGGNPEVISKVSIKREKGYLYYLDKNGNVARIKIAKEKK